MMKIFLLIFSCTIIVSSLFAQTSDSTKTSDKDKRFTKTLKIRESFQSEDTKPEPATFTYTKPQYGKESFLIDAALGFSMVDTMHPNLNWNLFGEYHRNTLFFVFALNKFPLQ